ncbi:MAG: hypothetical protein U5L95_01210 [Candidatus Saccharibacteria bacterium]|nr:hypothetical protein [Candidatus Saccharibacteria bacterium]
MANEDRKQAKTEANATKAKSKAMRPWYKKKRFIIPGIFLALLFLAPTEDTSPTSQGNGSETTIEEPSEMGVIPPGETTSFAEWDYKVVDIETHNVLGDERPRGQFVTFIVEVTNNANTEREIGDLFYAEDSQERVFNFNSSASLAHHHTYEVDTWHYEAIGASFSAKLPVTFDVPEDVEELYLYPQDIEERDFDTTKAIHVKL